MNCPGFELRIAALVDEGLTSQDVAGHLEACAECRHFAEELAADREALRWVPAEAGAVNFGEMRAELRTRILAERRPIRRWAIAACVLLAAGTWVVWKSDRRRAPVIAPPVVARAVDAAPTVEPPRHERAGTRKKARRAVPRPDPALEAALQAFLANKKAAEAPVFPPEKGVRIETGDPNIILILVSADSGGSYE